MRVFIMDTWAYPYRIPIFRKLAEQFDINLFFSKPIPRAHLSKISLDDFGAKAKSGKLFLAYIPFHLLWQKYDIYLVGQIGIQSVIGAYFTLLIAKVRCKPLILWTDYVETPHYIKDKPIKQYMGDLVRKIFTSQCTAAMAFGRYTADYLTKLTRGKLKLVEVKQIVPEVCNSPVVENGEYKKYMDKCVLFCVSYFQESKGLDFLITTFKEMNDDRAVLVLAGTGRDEKYLKRLAGDCNNIKFCGYVEDFEKATYFSEADIFVFTSDHETWGLVINEAMYYGLPVVVTSSCGGCELVTDNGIVIPPRDSESLKAALHQLIDNPELRKSMGEKSRSYISEYGLDYGVASFVKVIECGVTLFARKHAH